LLKDPRGETRPVITTFDRGNYSIRNDRWRFIHYEDGSEELYDHDADPQEWRNLVADPAHEQTRRQLRSLLPAEPAKRLGPPSKADGGG
jgi:arylsulfatase A-like enzyme